MIERERDADADAADDDDVVRMTSDESPKLSLPTLSLCSSRDLSTSAPASGPSDTAPSGACGADERASAVACLMRGFLFFQRRREQRRNEKGTRARWPLSLALSSFLAPPAASSLTLSALVRSSLDLKGGMRAWA